MEPKRRGLLTIGDFAQASQLSRKALRLYHRLGILMPAHIDTDSRYRYYRTDQLELARLVRRLCQTEMPLPMIRQVVGKERSELANLIAEYDRSFSSRVVGARRAIRDILSKLGTKEVGMLFMVDVIELDPQLVVSITGRTSEPQLDEVISSNLATLRKFVEEQGGKMVGGPMGIYHGPINEEADGPIEVCWPVQGRFSPFGDVVVRELDGGPAAHVPVKGEQCDFPTILEAYDAAADWINRNGYEFADSPRELWLSKPGEDEEMAVVWPFKAVR